MLVFPERLLHGDIPNRDFLHLYGPGSLWVARRRVQGVRRHAHASACSGLLQQAGVGVRRLLRRPLVGPAARGGVRAARARDHAAARRAHRLRVGRRGRPRPARSRLGLHAPATHRRRAAPRDSRSLAGVLFGVAFLFRLDLVHRRRRSLAVVLVWQRAAAPGRRAARRARSRPRRLRRAVRDRRVRQRVPTG